MTDVLVPVLQRWVVVCRLDDLLVDRGACVLVEGRQVAVFRVSSSPPAPGAPAAGDRVFAISNYDPFSGAYVLSRGIVGSRGDVPKVASPMYKQSFDLTTGVCLDDPSVAVDVLDVRTRDGLVEVRSR